MLLVNKSSCVHFIKQLVALYTPEYNVNGADRLRNDNTCTDLPESHYDQMAATDVRSCGFFDIKSFVSQIYLHVYVLSISTFYYSRDNFTGNLILQAM